MILIFHIGGLWCFYKKLLGGILAALMAAWRVVTYAV